METATRSGSSSYLSWSVGARSAVAAVAAALLWLAVSWALGWWE